MKKTLIALAALAATSAFAQSSVTLYGVVDLGYFTEKTTDAATSKTTGLRDGLSGNRFGMRGTEDLGGGLKANFTLEYGVAPDAAATPMNNRISFVGLNGDFGGVKLGQMYSQIHQVQGEFDANGNATAQGWLGGATRHTVRTANSIVYTTPSMSGFTAAVEMGFGENAQAGTATGKKGNLTAIGLTYAAGPLVVKAATETAKESGIFFAAPGITANATKSNVAMSDEKANRKTSSLGASYDLGVAKLMFMASSAKAGSAADTGKVDTSNFGVSVPMGAVTLNATASNAKYKDGAAAAVKASGYQLGATYALSKRTTAYGLLGEGKNKAVAATKANSFAVGIRHMF